VSYWIYTITSLIISIKAWTNQWTKDQFQRKSLVSTEKNKMFYSHWDIRLPSYPEDRQTGSKDLSTTPYVQLRCTPTVTSWQILLGITQESRSSFQMCGSIKVRPLISTLKELCRHLIVTRISLKKIGVLNARSSPKRHLLLALFTAWTKMLFNMHLHLDTALLRHKRRCLIKSWVVICN
jgi:hypothetical protein